MSAPRPSVAGWATVYVFESRFSRLTAFTPAERREGRGRGGSSAYGVNFHRVAA